MQFPNIPGGQPYRHTYQGIDPRNITNVRSSSTYGAFTTGGIQTTGTNPMIPKFDIQPDVQQIHQRYEGEAKEIKYKYESHLQGHIKLGRRIDELEALLAAETQKLAASQQNFEQLNADYAELKRTNAALEQKILYITEENRRKDHALSEADLKNRAQQNEIANLTADNARLRDEGIRLNDFFTNRVREIDDAHNTKLRQCNSQIDNLRYQIDKLQGEHAAQIRENNLDWERKLRKSEDQLRESARTINELEQKNRLLSDHVAKLKSDHEEQVRMVALNVRKDEYEKHLIIQRQTESKLAAIEESRDALHKKVEDLVRELQQRERESTETRIHLDQEISRHKSEINELRNQLSMTSNNLDRLKGDLIHKDGVNSKLHSEIKNLEIEINRIKDQHRMEQDRLRNDFSIERKRFEDVERSLRIRIVESEQIIHQSEEECEKIKIEYNRLRDMLHGAVAKTIDLTFSNQETKIASPRRQHELSKGSLYLEGDSKV